MMIENKNDNEIKLIVSFIEGVANKFDNEEVLAIALRILYDILIQTQYNCQYLLVSNANLFNKMM